MKPPVQWELAGSWNGEYRYDPVPGVFGGAPPSAFTLEIVTGWFGFFRGTVVDDPEMGMPGEGVVRGRRSGLAIRFVKRMPVLHTFTLDPATQAMTRPLQSYPGTPHPLIVYAGLWVPENDQLEGIWRMTAPWVIETGTWTARRANVPPGTLRLNS